MDRNDRQAIESLFEKLINVERQSPERDPEAEGYIREQIARHPGAPYYMAQTVVMQQQALEAAQKRIAELEAGIGSLRSPVPRVARSAFSADQQSPPEVQGQRTGGGFLAGAAQTALGVTGGYLLGNWIAGMMSGNKAEAAESRSDNEQADHSGGEEASYDGGGFDEFDI
jgi:hypothetical protein